MEPIRRLTGFQVNKFVHNNKGISYVDNVIRVLLSHACKFDYLEWFIEPFDEREIEKSSKEIIYQIKKTSKKPWEQALFQHILPSWTFLNYKIDFQNPDVAKIVIDQDYMYSEKDLIDLFKAMMKLKSQYTEEKVNQFLKQMYLIETFMLEFYLLEREVLKQIELTSFFGEWKKNFFESLLKKNTVTKKWISNRHEELQEKVDHEQLSLEGSVTLYFEGLTKIDLKKYRFFFQYMNECNDLLNEKWFANLAIMSRLHSAKPIILEHSLGNLDSFQQLQLIVQSRVTFYQSLKKYEEIYKKGQFPLDKQEIDNLIDLFIEEKHFLSYINTSTVEKSYMISKVLKHPSLSWEKIRKSDHGLDEIYRFIEYMWHDSHLTEKIRFDLQQNLLEINKAKRIFFDLRILEKKEYKWLAFFDVTFFSSYFQEHFDDIREFLLCDWGSEANNSIYCKYWEYLYKVDPHFQKELIYSKSEFLVQYIKRVNHSIIEDLREESAQTKLYEVSKQLITEGQFDVGTELAETILTRTNREKLVLELFTTESIMPEELEMPIKKLGFYIIGIDVVDGVIHSDEIFDHAEYYQLDEDVYSVVGAKWKYYLQKHGLLNTTTNEVIQRAIVHAEIDNEDELDDLFNDLGNI